MRPSPQVRNLPVNTRNTVVENGVVTFLLERPHPSNTPVFYRTYDGFVTPGYRNLKQLKKRLPFNPHVVHSYQVVSASGYRDVLDEEVGDVRRTTTYTSSSSHVEYPFLPSQLIDLEDRFAVRNKALDRMYSQLSSVKFNAAQALGERKQTVGLLLDTAMRITRAARAVRQGRLDQFVQSLSLSHRDTTSAGRTFRKVRETPVNKRLANHWLELQYGWKPLLSDAYAAAEIIAEAQSGLEQTTGRFKSSASSTFKYALKPTTGVKVDISARFSSKIVAHMELDSLVNKRLAQTGITNPALLAWELVPYSFVVDWFLPVGNYLSSLTATDGFSFKEGYLVEKVVLSGSYNAFATYKGFSPHRFTRDVSGSWGISEYKYSRTSLTSLPRTKLMFKNPIGGDPATRFATAMSLLRQQFRK